jgi:prevent-host-death family protein
MNETISAADANRQFSRLLRGVREGRTYVVTSHGVPVARISPVREEEDPRREAREALFRHLAEQPSVEVAPWTRAELYEDDR